MVRMGVVEKMCYKGDIMVMDVGWRPTLCMHDLRFGDLFVVNWA